ncbi:MAG TPA: MraY family glycosyltransferase, partial [Synergistales bacterium]|nr:MraY family glycosyltransferase [Synergistales bacterium]
SLSKRYGILDAPGERKIHQGIIPRGAGIVLWSGYCLWVLLCVGTIPALKYSASGATLIFITGYLDDIAPVNPYIRFSIHIVAALMIALPLRTSPVNSVILILWISGLTSAFNLIDGLNGLCIINFIISAICATFMGNIEFWIPLLALSLGLLGWNFPKARTFLGDGGSTLLGFLLGSHFLFSNYPKLQDLDLVTLCLILLLWGGIPMIDTCFAILRRIIRKGSPFNADQGHLHHRLLRMGIDPLNVVLILGVCHFMVVGAGFIFLHN